MLQLGGLSGGALQRGTGRRLKDRVNHALVLGRDEAGGNALSHLLDRHHGEGDNQQGDEPAVHDTLEEPRIGVGELIEKAVEPGEEPTDGALGGMMRVGLFKDHPAQDRSQGQRHDAREHDGNGHGDGKLTVEHPHRTAHERHWDEHRRHDQSNGDHRAADFMHHQLCRLVGRQTGVMHLRVHRFDHDDGVVDDDADGHHQSEERDEVNGDAHHLHQEEGSDEGDGNRERWDQRRPDVP